MAEVGDSSAMAQSRRRHHPSVLGAPRAMWLYHSMPHQPRLRDMKGLKSGDGTTQIWRLVIAHEKVGRIVV